MKSAAEIRDEMLQERAQAEVKALDALSRYKFAMFGYWAGIWVHLNRIIGDKAPNPFRHVVASARAEPAFVLECLAPDRTTDRARAPRRPVTPAGA